MKTRFLFLYCMLLCLSACNDEVFIDKLAPSVSEMSVPSDGSTVRMDLGTDDWDIYSVSAEGETLYGDMYDLNGTLLAGNSPLKGDGLLRMVSRHPVVDFVLERTCGNELQLTVNENPGASAFPLSVSVRNRYESRTLHLTLEPSEPYRLDSLVYHSLNTYIIRDSLVYGPANSTVVLTNRDADTLRQRVYPYRKASAFVRFSVHGHESLDLFGGDMPQVHIPEPLWRLFVLSDETYAFSQEYIPVPMYEKQYEVYETVTLPPFYNMLLETTVWHRWKEFDCTLYATHPRTGRRKCIDVYCERVDPRSYTLEQTLFAD